MPLTGDDAELIRLVSQLRTVGQVPQAARAQLAQIALARVLATFAFAREPGGPAWKALVYRKGHPLVLTGKLRGSFRARVTHDGFEISTTTAYAKHHQFGAPRAKVPARSFLPPDGTLPPAWAEAFERVVDQTLSAHFR